MLWIISKVFEKNTYGILQGSILGPLFFVIYINGLPSVINRELGQILLFAHDTKYVVLQSFNINQVGLQVCAELFTSLPSVLK